MHFRKFESGNLLCITPSFLRLTLTKSTVRLLNTSMWSIPKYQNRHPIFSPSKSSKRSAFIFCPNFQVFLPELKHMLLPGPPCPVFRSCSTAQPLGSCRKQLRSWVRRCQPPGPMFYNHSSHQDLIYVRLTTCLYEDKMDIQM